MQGALSARKASKAELAEIRQLLDNHEKGKRSFRLIPAHIAQALAWTLIHSLWEAALIAVILALILRILRAPTARYASACLAMLAILVSFALTFFLVLPPAATVTAPVPLPGLHGSTDTPCTTVPARLNLAAALPWLTPLWFAGVIIFHLRSLASWFAARRLVHHGVLPTAASMAAASRPTPRRHLSRQASDAAGNLSCRCSRRHRPSTPCHPCSGRPAHRHAPGPSRSYPAAQTGPHPPPRLPGKHAQNACLKLTVLSSGGLVDFERHPRRARELL